MITHLYKTIKPNKMKWIKLSDRVPTEIIDGEKVLLYKMLNEGQAGQNPSVFPTNKIHVCNPDETWWMALPEPPKNIPNN